MQHDMTKGNITPILIKFTIPLILGNLFQLTYNAADSIIVGNFVGKEALAAVGIGNPLTTLAILFINGMCLGASVLIGTQYGAKEMNTLERQISTTLWAGLVFAICFAAASILFAPEILTILQTPPEAMQLGVEYLRIIFAGLIFTFLYNFYASTLRALGDSKSPLYFLVISAILNILGDLAFVMLFGWGVKGCAFSTVISEALSCLFCGIYIKKKVPVLCLGRKWLVFDRSLLKKTISYSWATAMQQGTVQLGKIIVQMLVNSMGLNAVAAFAAVNRIDDFAFTPEQNIAHAMTTFLAQNHGAGKKDRIRKGYICGQKIEIIYGIGLCVVLLFFARPIMSLFVKDEAVIDIGVSYLRLMSGLYLFPAVTNCVQGFFRGMGDMKVTLWSSMINMGARVVAARICV